MPRLMPTYLVAYCWNKISDDPDEAAQHQPEKNGARSREFVPERRGAAVADRQEQHGDDLADGEECDERKRIHAGEIGLAVGDVHGAPKNSCAQSGRNSEGSFAGRSLMRRGEGKQGRSGKHAERSGEHAEPAFPSGVMQFFKEQDSPKNAKQAVGVPQRKGDAEANVADGVDGECVGDGPHASGENGPDDEVRSLADVGAHVRGTANEGGNAPAREEDAEHHDEGDRDRRDVGIDELDGSFGASEPSSGGKSAEDAESLQAAQASRINWALDCLNFSPQSCRRYVQRSLSRSTRPPMRTLSGIQKCRSVAMARKRLGRVEPSEDMNG